MNKADPLTLAEWMRTERITQASLAKTLGVDENTVYRWVHGKNRPHWKKVHRLKELSDGRITANSFYLSSATAA